MNFWRNKMNKEHLTPEEIEDLPKKERPSKEEKEK